VSGSCSLSAPSWPLAAIDTASPGRCGGRSLVGPHVTRRPVNPTRSAAPICQVLRSPGGSNSIYKHESPRRG
jgi:hypothetical protein